MPRRSSKVTLTSNRSSRIGYPRASWLGPKPCTGCLWLVGPDVKPGHGLTRVLPFGSPSGWRDQMTLCIGRREFITLLSRVVAAWPLAAAAQKGTALIGLLGSGSAHSSGIFVDSLNPHGFNSPSTAKP